MALSEVAICNDALQHLGQKAQIQALTDSSPQAKLCALYYPRTRDEMLARRRWSFAEKRVALSEASGFTVPTGWTYAYEAPGDMLEPREFWTGDTLVTRDSIQPYELVNRGDVALPVIFLTNVGAAELVYTAKVTNPALFPTLFAEALAWRLAERLGESLAESLSWASRATQYAEQKESAAWAVDLNDRRDRKSHFQPYKRR